MKSAVILAVGAVASSSARSSALPAAPIQLSRQELMQIEGATVLSQIQPRSVAARGIDVVTEEDLRRSRVFCLADARPLAGGLRINPRLDAAAASESASGRPILTTRDADGFRELGGHVRFVSQRHTRMRISVANLKACGLPGRAQLPHLAAQ